MAFGGGLPDCGREGCGRGGAGEVCGTYDSEFVFVGGLNIRLTKNLSAMGIFDGHQLHPTLTWAQDNWTIGLILAFGENLGVSATWRF